MVGGGLVVAEVWPFVRYLDNPAPLLDVGDLGFESLPLGGMFRGVRNLGSGVLPRPAECDLDRHAV